MNLIYAGKIIKGVKAKLYELQTRVVDLTSQTEIIFIIHHVEWQVV